MMLLNNSGERATLTAIIQQRKGRLGENRLEQRLVKTAAAVLVRAAFYGQLGHAIFRIGAVDLLAGGAGIVVNDEMNSDDARILLELAQRNRGLRKLQ